MNKFAILTFLLLISGGWCLTRQSLAWHDDATISQEARSENQPVDVDSSTPGAVGSEGAIPARTDDPQALELIRAAQRRLFEHASLRARFRETADFGNRVFSAEGTYLAGGPLQLRIEFEVQLGRMKGTLLQVCDGQVSWTRQEVGPLDEAGRTVGSEMRTVRTTRRDVNQILRAAEQQRGLEGAILVAELGIGGLPAMLAGIERMMTFERHTQQQIGGRAYHVIEGRWNDELRQLLTAGPEKVHIYLAQDTLFPERLIYLQRTTAEDNSFRPMFDLQFTEVRFGEAVNPEAFTFLSPPGTEEIDETRDYLQMLEMLRASGR